MQKKKILTFGLAGVAVATIVCLAASNTGLLTLNLTAANSSEVWKHYNGVAADFGSKGIKEYWVSCSSHLSVFEKPESAVIEEGGTPSRAFINGLADDDPRLLQSFVKYIDFENEAKTFPFYDLSKSTNIKSVAIVPDVGYNGSKCLAIDANNEAADRGLFFTKEYLDLVFADSSVKAIEFDARCDSAASNFRHRTSSGSNVCYEHNSGGWGLTSQWKAFSFTRAMYEDIQTTGGFVIWGTLNGSLYIDNVRPVTKDLVADNTVNNITQTMDALGKITGVGTSQDNFIYNAYQNVPEMKIWASGSNNLTLDYSTTVKSEGTASLHIHKIAGTTINFGLTNRIIDNLDDTGITFDILTTVSVGPANFQMFKEGRGSANVNGNYTLIADKWNTVTIAKTNIRDCADGSDYVFSFTGTDGQKEMDIYLDNFRPATPTDDKIIDFNDVGMFTYDSTYREFASNFKNGSAVNPINASNLRDTGKSNFWINNPNGAGTISLDYEKTSEGDGSLRLDIVDGSKGLFLFFNKNINSSLNVGDSIAIDVYNECNGVISLGKAPNAGRNTGVECPVGQWTTVVLTKTNTKADQFFRINEDGVGAVGTFWIDNVRIIRAA